MTLTLLMAQLTFINMQRVLIDSGVSGETRDRDMRFKNTNSTVWMPGSTATLVGIFTALGLWLASDRPAVAGETPAEALETTQAMVTAAGLNCTVLEAHRAVPENNGGSSGRRGGRGGGMGGSGMGGAAGSSGGDGRSRLVAYEASCQEGMGFILVTPHPPRDNSRTTAAASTNEQPPQAPPDSPPYLNCLEAKEAADRDHFPFECHLKTNKDQLRLLQKMADDIQLGCTITAARGLGHTDEKSFFEIACRKKAENAYKGPSIDGFVLAAQRSLQLDKPVSAASCLNAQANPNLRCTLTKVAGIIDALQHYVAKNAPGCMPAAQRMAGASPAGGYVFEVSCQSGASYLVHRADDGEFDTLSDCASAALSGKCLLVKSAVHPALEP
jgi:hypothetical protein